MEWRFYLPKSCCHDPRMSAVCSACVENTLNNLLETIITEVSRFDSSVVFDGENETLEQKLINKYADGIVQGYKDAVKQITDFLKDLRN
jgi:hypothetical protein